MSTRSHIGVHRINEPEKIDYIYCHSDGYPEHQGFILTNYYNTIEKVNELMKLGDLSYLGEEIGEKHDMDKRTYFQKRENNWCSAFGRDRGETGTEAKTDLYFKVASDNSVDYFYIFSPSSNKWFCIKFNTQLINLDKFTSK